MKIKLRSERVDEMSVNNVLKIYFFLSDFISPFKNSYI